MTGRTGWMGSLGGQGGGRKQDSHSGLAWTEEQEEQLCLLSGRQEDRCGLGYGYIDDGDTGKKGRHRRWSTATSW